jgi:hypothetical protein
MTLTGAGAGLRELGQGDDGDGHRGRFHLREKPGFTGTSTIGHRQLARRQAPLLCRSSGGSASGGRKGFARKAHQ